MLKLELHKYHIPTSAVPLVISGSAGVRVQAMLSGRIDATFAHFDGWLALKGHGVRILSTVAKDVPQLADSFVAAKPDWIQAHQKLATAIDEAYLESAHFFQKNENGWIAAARQYTGDTTTKTADLKQMYKTLKRANLYPNNGSGFSTSVLKFNANASSAVGALNSAAPALSQWTTTRYWKIAVKAVLGHAPR